MQPSVVTEEELEDVRGRVAAYEALGERYRNEPDFRSRIDGGDVTDALSELGLEPPSGLEVRIVADTADTVHMVLPSDPNAKLSDEALAAVSGGSSAGNSPDVHWEDAYWAMIHGWRLNEFV